MNALIRLEQLTFAYGKKSVLQAVNLAVPQGCLMIVAGPNGTGKSTLLRLVAGLLQPTSGNVLLHNTRLAAYSQREKARHIAYLPQHCESNAAFTVRQTVFLGRAPWQNSQGAASEQDCLLVDQALEAMELTPYADAVLEQLSGGEKQRVFLARILAQQTRLLVLDEPTAPLDYAHQLQVMELLAKLCATQGITAIMAVHDINLAALYATHMVCLHDYSLIGPQTPSSLIQPDLLERVFACKLLVDTHPQHGCPRVSLVRQLTGEAP